MPSSASIIGDNEIVITGITLIQGAGINKTVIGANYNDTVEWLGTIDLVEIYEGTLTPSEVANLYKDTWNKELSTKADLYNNTAEIDEASDFDVRDGTLVFNSEGFYRFTETNATTHLFREFSFVLGKRYVVKFDLRSPVGYLGSGLLNIRNAVGYGSSTPFPSLGSLGYTHDGEWHTLEWDFVLESGGTGGFNLYDNEIGRAHV